MSIETIAKGLTAAIKAISKEDDAKVALGETHIKKRVPTLFLFSKLENSTYLFTNLSFQRICIGVSYNNVY